MTFMEAALAILEDAGEPLHYGEITRRALERGLLKTTGKTPDESLNSRLSVEIKKNGDKSVFVRTEPGTFGLRKWIATGQIPSNGMWSEVDDALVRVPDFPPYEGVRLLLPVCVGLTSDRITGLYRTITNLTGSPQETVDWSNPDVWIPKRLTGEQQALALKIWKATKGTVNPRYIFGPWALASRYGLLEPKADGRLELTARGRDFIENPEGSTVRWLDEREGLLKLLAILADRGQTQTQEIWEPWRVFLDAESNIRSDSYARMALYDRLRNLLARKLVVKSGRATSLTEAGLVWLRKAGPQLDASGSQEEQDIWSLAKQHEERVREALLDEMRSMNPYAFEHLIAALLDEMGYDDPTVTARSNDKGVDVVASIKLGISSVREVVQAKRQKGNIHRPVLDALRGSLHRFQAVRGTIITTGGFATGTIKAAFEPGAAPITLIDGEALVNLLMEHNIGVRRRELTLWEIDTAAFVKRTGQISE